MESPATPADAITYLCSKPTTIEHCGARFHESLLRSWSLLQHVKEMLARRDSHETVLLVIDLVQRSSDTTPWSLKQERV